MESVGRTEEDRRNNICRDGKDRQREQGGKCGGDLPVVAGFHETDRRAAALDLCIWQAVFRIPEAVPDIDGGSGSSKDGTFLKKRLDMFGHKIHMLATLTQGLWL